MLFELRSEGNPLSKSAYFTTPLHIHPGCSEPTELLAPTLCMQSAKQSLFAHTDNYPITR